MQIWCGLRADQLGDRQPELVVLPEGVSEKELVGAARLAPNAIIVGAIAEGGRMRGVVRHRAEEKVSYWKVGEDQRSRGSPAPIKPPIYVCDEVAVGLLICMDVDNPQLLNQVLAGLHGSTARHKALCIAGDMTQDWFPSDPVGYASWGDLHVALSNNENTYGEFRRRNFITDFQRRIAVAQTGSEAISFELDEDFS